MNMDVLVSLREAIKYTQKARTQQSRLAPMYYLRALIHTGTALYIARRENDVSEMDASILEDQIDDLYGAYVASRKGDDDLAESHSRIVCDALTEVIHEC